ncbi:MAG: NACHT domain-containing protein [Sulfuricurvum sp.]|uniref:NACHT domain-containing protein n=1 Tax=Sulfuricurvum sp. TaxID=2025608 RepID=UPI00262DE574|nr:NACHT domain-containing protein [Sulfuricurvum sp.]MDD5160918.1 NACHT domain-containing protein [Sulfuricurvum sp.]
MSLTNYSRYKYTPDEMEEREFLSRFVVRTDIFNEIFEDIKSANHTVPQQHYIIIGQRGQGKTTLLRKVLLEVKNSPDLSERIVPVKFSEEQYQIRSLSRLWEEVADYLQSIYPDSFPDILDKMEGHFEDDDYELKSFSLFENTVIQSEKKLLLLIDNIDELIGKLSIKEQRRLREILLSSSSIRIIGGSTDMLEQHHKYDKPFYQFFKIIKLRGFNESEAHTFLRAIAKEDQKEQIETLIRTNPARIETLRRLTGGVPRTLVMLFDILMDDGGNAFDDLLKILDEVTPLYKHRMDDLPPQLQEIVHTIAMNWDGMFTREVAKKTKLESKAISSQLKQLEKYEIVESESIGKNKIYKIKERFFNIWYLMRYGRKKDRQRVEWLVKFLESWYSKEELEERAKRLIDSLQTTEVSPNHAYHMAEALSHAGIGVDMEHKLKSKTMEYLLSIKSDLAEELSESDLDLLLSGIKGIREQNTDQAKKNLLKIKNKQDIGEILDIIIKRLEAEDAIDELHMAQDKIIQRYSKTNYDEMFDIHNTMLPNGYYSLALMKLKCERFEESYIEFIEWCSSKKQEHDLNIQDYLILLIAKGQYYQAKKFFEMEEYGFKDIYKPIWYALMSLMGEDEEYKKMGSELTESVNEVLARIREYEEKYGSLS